MAPGNSRPSDLQQWRGGPTGQTFLRYGGGSLGRVGAFCAGRADFGGYVVVSLAGGYSAIGVRGCGNEGRIDFGVRSTRNRGTVNMEARIRRRAGRPSEHGFVRSWRTTGSRKGNGVGRVGGVARDDHAAGNAAGCRRCKCYGKRGGLPRGERKGESKASDGETAAGHTVL